MEEGRPCSDRSLVETGCTILDGSLDPGWDKDHGGILCFSDLARQQPVCWKLLEDSPRAGRAGRS
jgi:hypothetical protein